MSHCAADISFLLLERIAPNEPEARRWALISRKVPGCSPLQFATAATEEGSAKLQDSDVPFLCFQSSEAAVCAEHVQLVSASCPSPGPSALPNPHVRGCPELQDVLGCRAAWL